MSTKKKPVLEWIRGLDEDGNDIWCMIDVHTGGLWVEEANMGGRKLAGISHEKTSMMTQTLKCSRCKKSMLSVRGKIKKKGPAVIYCEPCVQKMLALAIGGKIKPHNIKIKKGEEVTNDGEA